MAMQRFHSIKETHSKPITAICYNPMKHEIMAGCEDQIIRSADPRSVFTNGTIKTWEWLGDNIGKQTRVSHEHTGLVNCFLYWSDAKIILSAGNDGRIIAWGSTMLPLSVTKVPTPVYSMAWNVRRKQLILGVNGGLRVYNLLDSVRDGKIFNNNNEKVFIANEHSDIVKGIVCHETRVYSAGFDRKLCIYDAYSYPGKKGLHLISCLYPAHEAGISTLIIARDNESNTWLITGGFDKTVKIWSQDGQILHKFDGFSGTVTGICYVSATKTVWIAAGTPEAPMYDPKSGDNVSEFIGTFQNNDPDHERNNLLLLQFVPEINQIIATDSRRKILTWKYNPTGCITALKHRHGVESLAFTKKVPILVFTGDSAGQITKWERMQSNTFMYSKESLPRSEAVARLATLIQKYDWAMKDKRQIKQQLMKKTASPTASSIGVQTNIAALATLFVEELDLLLVASEDNNIYVWGFDYEAVKILQQMQPQDDPMLKKFAFLLQNKKRKEEEEKLRINKVKERDSVTDRVAGFICKTVFSEHTQCVTCMAVVNKHGSYKNSFLLSGGWDRRIYIWNLDDMCFHDVFRNYDPDNRFEEEELAADGIIMDMAYSQERDEFAYSSSDKLVYIRNFSEDGTAMKLKAVLQGHEAAVTKIKWNEIYSKWISGSEDGTIRVWSCDGLTCDMVLSSHGAVSAMCIDSCNGCIVAGIEDTIRVYDIDVKTIVQTNIGHTDAIRCLLHVPERSEYLSASWDKTVRVWNAYKRSSRRNVTSKD